MPLCMPHSAYGAAYNTLPARLSPVGKLFLRAKLYLFEESCHSRISPETVRGDPQPLSYSLLRGYLAQLFKRRACFLHSAKKLLFPAAMALVNGTPAGVL
jgi:hypothetical protein